MPPKAGPSSVLAHTNASANKPSFGRSAQVAGVLTPRTKRDRPHLTAGGCLSPLGGTRQRLTQVGLCRSAWSGRLRPALVVEVPQLAARRPIVGARTHGLALGVAPFRRVRGRGPQSILGFVDPADSIKKVSFHRWPPPAGQEGLATAPRMQQGSRASRPSCARHRPDRTLTFAAPWAARAEPRTIGRLTSWATRPDATVGLYGPSA